MLPVVRAAQHHERQEEERLVGHRGSETEKMKLGNWNMGTEL